MTNGKPHTSTTVSLLANFHLLISQHLLDMMSGDLTRNAKVRRELINVIPDNPLQSIFRDAIRNASDEELATLIDMHRIALTYVTNKKGGDQIMAAEGDATVSLHEDFEIPEMTYLDARLISGAVDRWAEKALLRTMSSLMQAYLVGVRQTLQFLDLDDNQKNRVRDFGTTLPIRNLLNRNPSAFYRDLSDFVSRAIGLHHHRYQPTAWKIFESLLKTKIQDIGQDILRYDDILSLSEFFEQLNRDRRRTKEKPMTSLRDVDPAGSIYFRAPRARRRMEDGEAVEVMKILRRGYSAGNASE